MKHQKLVKPYGLKKEVMIYETECPQHEADFAMRLIQAHSLLVGAPDGEDTAGRARVRAATPEEIVDKACKISELAFKAFREKGWMLELSAPIFKEEEP